MTQLAGQDEGLPAPLQSLLGIAEHPKRLGRIAQAGHARVMAAIEKGMRAVLTGVIVSDRLLQVCPCICPISEEGMGRSQRVMRLQKERRVLRALGQAKQLLSQIQSCLDLPAGDAEEDIVPITPGRDPAILPTHGTDVRARVGRLNVGRRPVLGGEQGRAQGDLQGEFFAGARGCPATTRAVDSPRASTTAS